MQHALAVHNLGVLLERLTSNAIPPLVRLLEEVVRVALEDARDERLHPGAMRRIRGADELVVGDAELLPHGGKATGQLIHERLRSNAFLECGLLHLLAMLVHADEEIDVAPKQAVIPRDR